ncbi:hypothetical protein C2G38_2167384 [Gigaspora rosea]|uniref:Uncharacterized protein n=1 Tax=Gigaspora rosea TaxID=44941 RepID=A0A397VQV0_9GLOM|nr:hypothetical protein C2G38_2167384 [Gigaspora rosea]
MEEVKIWNHVIEWGITQNSGLSSDPEELKTTLQIKTLERYNKKGYDKPNKPTNIINCSSSSCNFKSALPTRITESFSTVVNDAHAAEIASWIQIHIL